MLLLLINKHVRLNDYSSSHSVKISEITDADLIRHIIVDFRSGVRISMKLAHSVKYQGNKQVAYFRGHNVY